MYAMLLAKRQSHLITCVRWRKKQLQLLWASCKNRVNVPTNYNYFRYYRAATVERTFGSLYQTTWLKHRLSSSNTQHGSQLEANNMNDVPEDKEELLIKNYNKQLLYTQDDDIMRRLNSTESISEMKSILDAEKSNLHKEHLVQALILQSMFNNYKSSTEHHPSQIDELKVLENILYLIKDYVPKLNMKELCTSYYYLRKLGVENTDPVLQQLLIRALDEINCTKGIIELAPLSRLIVAIKRSKNFFTPMLCANFTRHIQYHIELCKDKEDARMIAICLHNLQPIVTTEMMDLYKKRVSDLIASGDISSASPEVVINILHLLNKSSWSHEHFPLIRELLLTLKADLKQLNPKFLKTICAIYEYHMEPACLHEPLAGLMETLLSKQMTPENLAFYVPFAKPCRRETLINAFKALISSPECWNSPKSSVHLFSALRGLKISDIKICNAYWNGVLAQLEAVCREEIQLNFLRDCHRYMNFNNNLGGTYRHIELEKKLCQLCMRNIEHDVAGRLPKKFSRLASFVLAYGHTSHSWEKYPNILLSKIINMRDQFTPTDCVFISRGLQISLEMRYRYKMPHLVGMQLATIDNILTTCVEKHLNDDQLKVTDLNMLVRVLSTRKSLKNSVVYHKTLQKYKEIQCQHLNSRIVKDIAYNLLATNYLVPETLEQMFSYIEHNHEHITGDTVEKILTCAYNLGYIPQSYEALHYAGDILLRYFNYTSGLALVQSCLALCYYKTIPEELVNKVFCVKFIQRVEEEIQKCYSKATYPERVLNNVMQLNRSVCLDFPEANVPWFQQSYIEAQISKKRVKETRFGNSVKKLLTAVLRNESYIRCNHVTPYGYQIDFVINFDQNKNPIEAPVETTMLDRITKVAILLLKLDSFCENDLTALKGADGMKMRHLEMMGYKVLHINEHDWNSKYMNLPGAKQKYLKCLLQIT